MTEVSDPTTFRRGRRRLVKETRRAVAHAVAAWLSVLGRHGRRSVIDPHVPVVVSLTSFGDRLGRAHVAVESIARGSTRPGRLILWIDPDEDPSSLPPTLGRLARRGLEIRTSPWDIGPHKKYYPVVAGPDAPCLPLVTADDDVLYPRRWLEELLATSERSPDSVVAHRVRDLLLCEDGRIAPYNSWPLARGTTPALRHFATGSSGALYPVTVQLHLRDLGRGFESCCPRADDLWLHHAVITSGSSTRQVRRRSRTFLEVPGTQARALSHENTGRSANDPQVLATYSAEALVALRAETVTAPPSAT